MRAGTVKALGGGVYLEGGRTQVPQLDVIAGGSIASTGAHPFVVLARLLCPEEGDPPLDGILLCGVACTGREGSSAEAGLSLGRPGR